jgi:hypothetical protein
LSRLVKPRVHGPWDSVSRSRLAWCRGCLGPARSGRSGRPGDSSKQPALAYWKNPGARPKRRRANGGGKVSSVLWTSSMGTGGSTKATSGLWLCLPAREHRKRRRPGRRRKRRKRCRWQRIASGWRPSSMRVLPMPRQRLPSMKAAPRDAVVAARGLGGIIRSALTWRRSANGKNGQAGDARRKGSHRRWSSATGWS